MDKGKTRSRDVRMDLIRFVALLFVCATHFFLHSGFNSQTVAGPRMYAMVTVRSLVFICVQMFITLTGYLMCEKKLNAKYFKGILPVLTVYLASSLIYSAFSAAFLDEKVTVGGFLRGLLSYKGTPYGWYVEMYIGLFLLIPFINMGLEKLTSKRGGHALLIVLFVVIGLPMTVNGFSFESWEVWKNPGLTTRYFQILPDWWSDLYPIFFYCLGWYLRKFPFRPRLSVHFLLFAASVIADGAFNFYKSHGVTFVSASWNWNSSAAMMVKTFLFFSLLLRIPPIERTGRTAAVFKTLSGSVFGAYLLSAIFDKLYYQKLNDAVPVVTDRFIYAPLIVLAVFVSSMLLSLVVYLVINGLSAVAGLLVRRFKKKEVNGAS